MDYMEKAVYTLTYTRLYDGSLASKIDFAQELLVNVSDTEF
jgi:hypothetical protein